MAASVAADTAVAAGAATAPTPLRSPGRLFRKYAVLLIGLVATALLASGVPDAWLSYQEAKSALLEVQRARADAAAHRIERFVAEIARQMGWLVQPQWAASPLEQRRADVLRLFRQVPAMLEVSQLDGAGIEQLKISRVAIDDIASHADRSQDPAFLGARARRYLPAGDSGLHLGLKAAWFGPVYFRDQSEPFITIALAAGGRNAGVIIAEVNLKSIWDIIILLSGHRAATAPHSGGDAYVVDGGGRLIAHRDISLVLRNTSFAALPQVAAAIGDDSASPGPAIATDVNGRSVLTAHAEIDALGWIVFVERPLSEALAPAYGSAIRTGALLALGLAVATLAALFLARRMVRPIRALQQGALRIGAGELDERIEIRSGDEFEDLAASFNSMGARLRESYGTLERKVEERTRELAETVAELRIVNETVQEQAAHLRRQADELADWNRRLEQRVADQVGEIERVSRLKRFLSPQLADLLVTTGDERMLESHRRDVAIVFCDLRGFTALAETAEPEEVMEVLGQYHAALGDIIHRFEGTLERFLGDGLMVLFNDPIPCPDPAERAVKMAVAMRDCVARLAEGWRKRGRELGFGVGIAQGYATLGRIGFEGRFDYAAIGTVANLASRLCGEAKPGQILASQRVMTAVEGLVEADPLGDLPLKGLAQPVATYNIRRLTAAL